MARTETTTDLNELKTNRFAKFTWGTLIKIHELREYAIVEFEWKGFGDNGKVGYHPYVNGKSCGESYSMLDRALAAAIAYKREGANHCADAYFINGMLI